MTVVHPLIPLAIQGGTATIIAYGQTGAGKTHSATGLQKYLAADIFAYLGKRKDNDRKVRQQLRRLVEALTRTERMAVGPTPES